MGNNERPWISDRAHISPWAHEVTASLALPDRVTIYDVTLRDGEQYPGLVFTKEDKTRLAGALDTLGIERLEAGMPAVSQEDFAAVYEISKRVRADVVVFCRGMHGDVDLAVDAGACGVIVELPSNQTLIEKGFGWTKDDVIKKGIDTCNYAKTNHASISSPASDSAVQAGSATRASFVGRAQQRSGF